MFRWTSIYRSKFLRFRADKNKKLYNLQNELCLKPTHRCQLLETKCEISFAECGNQPDVSTSKRVPGSKAPKAYTNWALVLYWKILFGEQIHNCSKVFHFNKLTYKSCFNSSIHPSFPISARMRTIVSPVSALFCRKISEKVSMPVKTTHYQMKKGRA